MRLKIKVINLAERVEPFQFYARVLRTKQMKVPHEMKKVEEIERSKKRLIA